MNNRNQILNRNVVTSSLGVVRPNISIVSVSISKNVLISLVAVVVVLGFVVIA